MEEYTYKIVKGFCDVCKCYKSNIIQLITKQMVFGYVFNSRSNFIRNYCPDCLPKDYKKCECGCSYTETYDSGVFIRNIYKRGENK